MRKRTGCSANIAESMTRAGSGPPVERITSGNNNEWKSTVLICFMNTQFMQHNSTECSIYQLWSDISRRPGQVKLLVGESGFNYNFLLNSKSVMKIIKFLWARQVKIHGNVEPWQLLLIKHFLHNLFSWPERNYDHYLVHCRIKALHDHMGSVAHITAATAEDPTQRSITSITREMDEKEKAAYRAALKSVYWIATEEISNSKYSSLLELERQQGVKEIISLRRGGNCTKESPQVFNELLEALNEVLYWKFTGWQCFVWKFFVH